SGASPNRVRADIEPFVDFAEEEMSIDAIKELMEKNLLPHLMQYDLRGFQSMFNAFPENGAKLGARIALDYNQGVTNWQVSPGGAMLEELCCQALCRLFGLLPSSDATFMYSGTYANFQAVYLALHWKAELEGFDFSQQGLSGFSDLSRLKLIISREAHFSLRHAVRSLGLGDQCLVPIKVDKNRRIDIGHLEKTIKMMRSKGDIFCIVATAGTTSTGSVDPIKPIAEIAECENIWLHVDGAYGLAYSLVPAWKHLFRGLEQADSITWDPHKQMRVPIPNSLLFLKRGSNFQRMRIHSEYFNLPDSTEPNPGLKSPPSTRPFSALSLVTSIKHQGLKGLRDNLRAPLEVSRNLANRLNNVTGIELALYPDTGIVCFRVRPDDFPEDQLNNLQELIFRSILREGKHSISITQLERKKVLRLVALSPKMKTEDMLRTVDMALEAARRFMK
ncbi:MAG: pyridoxal-dependent decarboxylase, partial [Anaerolineales bacterium]